jgi:hypothetical protein
VIVCDRVKECVGEVEKGESVECAIMCNKVKKRGSVKCVINCLETPN